MKMDRKCRLDHNIMLIKSSKKILNLIVADKVYLLCEVRRP